MILDVSSFTHGKLDELASLSKMLYDEKFAHVDNGPLLLYIALVCLGTLSLDPSELFIPKLVLIYKAAGLHATTQQRNF